MKQITQNRIEIISRNGSNIPPGSVSYNPSGWLLFKGFAMSRSSTTFKNGHKGLIGEQNYSWKGDKVGYFALHNWIKRWYGRPKRCEHCGTTTAKRFEWANISKLYKRDRSDWLRLCSVCHQIFDDSRKKRAGATSKYRGVSWVKEENKWKAVKIHNHKRYYLGCFVSEIEAAKAYDKAIVNILGKHAITNFNNKKKGNLC